MTAAVFEAQGQGRYTVRGPLGFHEVPSIWKESRLAIHDADTCIDLGDVTEVDSATLALVIEWIGWAESAGKRLRLARVPEQLVAIARLSEADGFLSAISDV